MFSYQRAVGHMIKFIIDKYNFKFPNLTRDIEFKHVLIHFS